MDPEHARELLERERARIEKALAELAPADEGDERGETGSEELYQKEFEEGRAGDLRQQLEALERAEARLAAGTYGRSVQSGTPIPDKRLEALPAAERTVEEEQAG